MSLTATPEGGTGTATYQWYKGGTAEGNKIAGATSATYTKSNCTFEDAGQYYCKVSTGAECSKFSSNFDVKMLRLYLFTGDTQDGYYDLVKTGTNTASVSIPLGSSWNYNYYITDGCGHNYGNTGTMTSANCTNWTMNSTTNKCGITTTKGASYAFNVNCANYAALQVSVVYPSTVQTGGYNLYFANNERNWSNIHYRIGRDNWNSKAAMTLVPGTANLYQTTTIHYESDGGFDAWHIANNGGWSNGNSIYKTKTGDGNAITNATRFEGAPVPSTGLTVIPGSDHSTGGDDQNNNCEFYSFTTVPGMWTHNVSITPPSYGTLTVNYVDVSGTAQAFSSGNRDLAHTCIITVTAVPGLGYQEPATISINGSSYGNRDPYTLMGDIVVSAVFPPAVYTVTLNTNGGTINADNVTSYTYGTGATLPTNVTKDGYTFDGWFDNAGLTGSAVTTISSSVTGNKEFWAKWTEAAAPSGVCWDPATTPADKLANNTTTLTTLTSRFAAIDGVTSVTVDNPGTGTGQCAGSDDSNGYLKVKNATTTKIITIVTTAPTNITIGGKKYGDNSGSFYLVKSTDTETKLAECNTNAEYEATNLPAGTYYIYAKASTKSINFSKLCIELYECSTPAAPTGFTAGSITSTGATFTITDAANAASYDIYYSTSSSAPDAGTAATTTSDSKTKAVTGLTASTTYYAWVRSVCDADHKSAWLALGTTSFKTSAAATYTVTYNGNGEDGGSVPEDASSPYTSGSTVTVLGNTGSLTRTIDDAAATFYGWNTNSSGYGGTHYEAGNTFSITANTTLYAEWGFPITYNTDGGTINDLSYPTHYIYTGSDDCTTATLPTDVTKAGYTFDGWSTRNGAGSVVTCISGEYTGAFAGDYALKAKWEEVSDCETIAEGVQNSGHNAIPASTGTITTSGGSANNSYVKLGTSGYFTVTAKDGSTPIVAGDKLTVTVYNNSASAASRGFKLKSKDAETSHTATIAATSTGDVVYTLTADDIEGDGTIKIFRTSADDRYHAILLERCGLLPSCTTPVIPSLSDQTVCPGSDIAAWDATPSNASAISAAGESVSYSWKKKGNNTELATTASFDLGSSATEGQAGTYVVTVTVSKASKASASASAEVDLAVTPATETPSVSASKAKVYQGDAVTLTATCGSTGVTYAWYTCAADGTSAVATGSTSSTQSIASAPAAGTYYYKVVVTGDGTHSCGFAEYIYTLVVSAPGECETYVWWEEGAPTGQVQATCFTFGATPSGSNNQSLTMTIDGTTYTSTKRSSDWNNTITFTIPTGSTGTFYICGKGTGARTITLTDTESHTSTFSMTTTFGTFHSDEIGAGTWTMTTNGNLHIGMVALYVCSTSTCTDAIPTATATNTTVCSGSELSITATGYEESPTSIQWQKLNSSTSTWDNISGATSATYTVASATSENAGSYRVVVTKGCARTSNTVTIAVPSAPNFGSTVPASVSVMQTIALSINTVEATDATKYKWYKSADATWDAGDVEIGTNKELIKAYDSEAIGNPSYYIFCRAQNACGITTSTAIAVNVTAYVEEDCATRGNEGDAEFSFENSGAGQGSYESTACWTMNSNSKILVYYPPTGKYFKTAKVTIASSSENKASYNWSTNGGTDYTAVSLTVNSTLTERTINLSTHGNVDAFQIGRNFDSQGSSGGTLYVSKICFEYTEACTATTVTPSTSSVNYEMGGAWSNPTFTLSVAGTLTYSSSNEDIASVDDDGTVTFNGEAGTVTITASYAGGTISETEYCASSGSYTINVSCPGGAPKIEADGSTDMVGCNTSVTLHAKTQDGTAFADGTYQWFRNGTEIVGATSSSYTATQAGTYTVERTSTSDCTTPSTNSAIVTSETTEPEVELLVPFQYYHVDKTYSDQMKMRHLFAVKNSGTLDGKHFKMYVSRNGGAATDVTSSNALVVWPNGDGHVDTVMVDLNKLSGKYSENDELVFTCKAIDCSGYVSDVYKNNITMNVIGATPTLALICSGAKSDGTGTRVTKEMTVGGDFLTGWNPADLCQQTGNKTFDGSQEWGLYTELKEEYIVKPVNGYAPFNKLNYEPFDIIFLTDYPKASKSDAAKDILDDMAALCDYRPLFSFKTHMVAKTPSKWAAKGFTTSATENKAHGRLNLNIVCYAHPMFESLKTGSDVYEDANNTSAPLIYTMLSGEGYESGKGMQGFEIAAAENFVTIGLTHYNGTIAKDTPNDGEATWTPGEEDRMLVTVAERQTNIEARMILFSVNAGAHSKLTDKGEQVVLACLRYLLDDDPLHVADCSFTFDNGAGINKTQEEYKAMCPSCSGTIGDHKWSTQGNWGPDYRLLPGEYTAVRIVAPVTVDMEHAHVREVRIKENGQITIPAGKALEIVGTIRRLDGTEISPTENSDITIGSSDAGNGTLIFNNDKGDTKARVNMYSNAQADITNMSAATSVWQYIGTPHTDVANARSNYYGSWLYQYVGGTWTVIPNGGPLVAFRGYCITNETAPIVYDMAGTLAATTTQDIAIPAGYTVIANSWVAPIDISTFTDDDMENISDKTIYFFNTGTDADGNHGTGTAPGTYVAVPKNSASYVGTWQIPSMQGFYISTTSAGTLHLDYDRHVRPTGGRTIVSSPMYAPRRAAAESDEPNVLKIFARGSRYQDKLVVLEREDFTRGYDSGWDGEAWGGSDLSPMVYVTGEGREDAVSAIPEFEGTVIAFKAGEDSEYRFEFIYSEDAEPLYLFDTENNTYTQIMTGNAYYFTTTDKAAHSRFILTRKAPQITTGTELASDGESAKARKLLIEDKMYILLNGMLYDATGKVVK